MELTDGLNHRDMLVKIYKNHIINQLEGGKDSFKHKMSIYETALSE